MHIGYTAPSCCSLTVHDIEMFPLKPPSPDTMHRVHSYNFRDVTVCATSLTISLCLLAGLKPSSKSTLPPNESIQYALKSVTLDSNQNTFDNHKNCKTKEPYHAGEKWVSRLGKDP